MLRAPPRATPNQTTTTPQDPADYPRRVQPNQLFVDMEKEVVFAPINGQPVPLSIHTIKNVTQPDPDNHCHYLRINFFTSGAVRLVVAVVLVC